MNLISDFSMVSIIVPCRNEEEFITACLESILANDYPKDWLEILVVDGMSEDGTRWLIESYAQKYSFIRLLDNPRKITPVALNIGISHATGQIIMRMDAHATYEKDYISKCVHALENHGADNVGGIWRIIPRSDSIVGKAIVRSLSHRFGIGNAYYRLANSKEPRWVDTVPFFCCTRDVFDRVSLFNESLSRGQDMEFNLRLKKAGGRTLLVPDIVSYYYARSDMKSFWKHNWSNGVWAILPFLYSPVMPVSWRHLAPLAFVSGLIGSGLLAFVLPVGLWMLLGVSGAYVLGNLAASVQVAIRQKDLRYLLVMPVIFSSLHLGYGLGSLWGFITVVGHTVFKLCHEWSKVNQQC